MPKNTKCAEQGCPGRHEHLAPERGPGVPLSRAVVAMEAWLAEVDLLLATAEIPVAA